MQRFDAEAFRRLEARAPDSWLTELSALDVTESTNDDALAAARNGATHGTTFVAERQTRGRGRRGRVWFAAPGESLLCSVVLRLPLSAEAAVPVSLAVGLALRAALSQVLKNATPPGEVLVKWPNDVWLNGKKVAGVLAESCLRGSSLVATVVGFGINLHTTRFPPELADSATSVALSGVHVTREQLLARIFSELGTRVQTLVAEGPAPLAAELSHYDALAGRLVRVEDTEGTARGIDSLGRLLIERADDTRVYIASGTVELAPSAKA